MGRIVVTGASGFVGQNLVVALKTRTKFDVVALTRNSDLNSFSGCKADHIVHLAGTSRAATEDKFRTGNVTYMRQVLECFVPRGPASFFHYASTVKAPQGGLYGRSKRDGEDLLRSLAPQMGWTPAIWRLPNLFGKWARPHHNSFVATFVSQIINKEPLSVHDPESAVDLLYIDDLIDIILRKLDATETAGATIFERFPTRRTTVGEVARFIEAIHATRDTSWLPEIDTPLGKQLQATYLSALEQERRVHTPGRIESETGSFSEMFKSGKFGQVSLLTINPGKNRGQHFHNTKCERFHLVQGRIKLVERDTRGGTPIHRTINENQSFWTRPGWIHTLENIGECPAILLIWANEIFQPDARDTYHEDGLKDGPRDG